ncbi:MAG TPA: hypothetical protein GXZ90_02495 [Clostridiales bacterium]|nr:hypothetical protein [Clostridiales bacterium]
MLESVDSAHRKSKINKLILDIVVISLGLFVSSFGIALFYASNLGSSPMATFGDGLHNILSISYGAANTLANTTLLILLFFIKKSYINIGTVLCVFSIGPYVSLSERILKNFGIQNFPMSFKILIVVFGTIMMGIGLGLYVAVERGYGPLEAIVKILCEEKGVSYAKAKILQDVLLVGVGVILQAKLGIGTVIAVILTGPILQKSIQFFTPILKKQ